ncbi:unnamed protein product [Mytilus edulis]|uniref:DZANK-type domain-containing protein n=1 Tax=Mytilus edulis TaxID=6550 RepID=A0A8S3SRP2_MYTED|nr:unnamed protein product [Mytilus edulis]
MKCAKDSCGADITDGAKFCSICGTKVGVTIPVKKALCTDCNHFVLESHNFCLNCGWKVDPAIFADKICRGVEENGEQCSVILTSDAKFCPSCGTPTKSRGVISEPPINTKQGTSEDLGKDTNLNPVVFVQKFDTKTGKENINQVEQERKGLPVEIDKNSDDSEPGSPEIWSPPTIFKKSSESLDQAEIHTEKLKPKRNIQGNQVQTSQENDSQDTYTKEKKNDEQSDRTIKISRITILQKYIQIHDMTGGHATFDHTVVDKTKSEQSTEIKINEENNRYLYKEKNDEQSDRTIKDIKDNYTAEVFTDTDTKEKKNDEQSDRTIKDIKDNYTAEVLTEKNDEQSDRTIKDIKDNYTAEVLTGIVGKKEESFSSDFVAVTQFTSQSDVNESDTDKKEKNDEQSDRTIKDIKDNYIAEVLTDTDTKEKKNDEQSDRTKKDIKDNYTAELLTFIVGHEEKVNKGLIIQPESNNMTTEQDEMKPASVSGLHTVGDEDKCLTAEKLPISTPSIWKVNLAVCVLL